MSQIPENRHFDSEQSALLLSEIFTGSDIAFGRSELISTAVQGSKREARCWTEKRPPTLADWQKHVDGITGIGIPPINSRSLCRFGAIDVDVYSGIDLIELRKEITRLNLPMVLCRSKSGGPHLYLFTTDWVPAKDMVEALDRIAAHMGFGSSEIFPKQTAIAQNENHRDFGNWINMPYFDARNSFRIAFDDSGAILSSIPAFAAYARQKQVTPDALRQLALLTEEPYFKDGPPCLNRIFSNPNNSARNVSLCNAAVYAKRAFPDSWQEKIDEYNRLFSDPLPSAEVENIKKSYLKKDYRYSCAKEPLCRFCNSIECKKKKYGIEDSEILPNNRSLTVINTSPPIWYLDVQTDKGDNRRISLSTDELQNPRAFQKRCMEVLKTMPPIIKQNEWEKIVKNLLRYCTQIDMPPESTPAGQFIELVQAFIIERKSDESPEVMLRGAVFETPTDFRFRWRDLKKWLDTNKFTLLKQNEMLAILKQGLNGEKMFSRITNLGVNYWCLPRTVFSETDPAPMSVSRQKDVF